jgi:DNA-binding CsgD family transcriptional regulator
MDTVVGNLFDRAERVGAALVICDDRDRIIRINSRHAQIYDFVDHSAPLTFQQFGWRCIENRKPADPRIYQDPHTWMDACVRYRRFYDHAQIVVHHTDGRVLLTCYEKIRDVAGWWYQARIDITQTLKMRVKQDGVALGPAWWEPGLAPVARPSAVPDTNLLDAVPAAAGLIMSRGLLLEANQALCALLRTGDGLVKQEGRVVARDPAEQGEFRGRLARFFKPDGPRSPVAMRISRCDSEEPYFVTVSPLLGQQQETWDNGPLGMLTVANPSVMPLMDPGMLAEFFGITLAEAEVAAALGAGQTTAFIAEQRGVQINTIYAQIKQIGKKTRYKGQADIARRVSDLARIFGTRQVVRGSP